MVRKESSWTQDSLDDRFQRVASVDSLVSRTSIKKRNFTPMTTYTSACYKDFKIWSYILNIYGIQIFEDRDGSLVQVPKFILFCTLCLIYYIAVLAMTLYVALTESLTDPAMRFADILTYNILSLIEILWVYSVLFHQQDKFQELFDHLSAISIEVLADDAKVHRKVRNYSKIIIVGIVCFIIGYIILTWRSMVFSLGIYSSTPWENLGVNHSLRFACGNNSTVTCLTNVHLALTNTMWGLITLPLYSTFVLVCLFLSYTISGHFSGLLEKYNLGTNEERLTCNHVHNLISRHHSLTKIVKLYDDIFRQPLGIWSLEEFVNIVFTLRMLNLHKDTSSGCMFDMVVVISSMALFILKLAYVSYLNNQVTSTLQGLTIIAEVNDLNHASIKPSLVTDIKETKFRQQNMINSQIEMYIRHVDIQPPGVSGMGLFCIYSGVLLTACGQSLTYILALYGIPDGDSVDVDWD